MNKSQIHGRSRSTSRRCGDLILRLRREGVVPFPFDIDEFVSRFRVWRGRDIHLEQIHVDRSTAALPCGLLVKTATADHIFYVPGTTPLHRDHIIVHEVAHILFGHENGASLSDLAPILFPDLDPQMVDRVLNRASYTTKEEYEAETFASLFVQQIHSNPSPPASDVSSGSGRVPDLVENTWGRSKR